MTPNHLHECNLGAGQTDLLPLLYEMGQVATESTDLSSILNALLRLMRHHMRSARGMVTLFDQDSGNIVLHESFGLSQEESRKGVYLLSEELIGQVVETGQSIVLACTDNPAPYPQTGNRSLICVPIMRGHKVMGTISAEQPHEHPEQLQRDLEVLSVLATLTAQSVELYLLEQVEQAALESENQRLKLALGERFKPSHIIGNSKPMQELYRLIERVVRTQSTILILGESGVGKERVARAIHHHSPAQGPFVKFNCAALPVGAAERTLFGHETNACANGPEVHKGCLEAAAGGSIFLDEVDAMPLGMQAKLLRVLQAHRFERVDGNTPLKVKVRIIAATQRDLGAMVAAGTFHEELYYQLNTFPITIPPLRERGSDIITLADHFVARLSKELGVDVKRISTPALNRLYAYHWPGNVQELKNTLEQAILSSEEGVIYGYNLPDALQAPVIDDPSVAEGSLEARLNAIEYELIVDALKLHQGNMTEAAHHLGLTRRVLGLRMAKYNLDYKDFR